MSALRTIYSAQTQSDDNDSVGEERRKAAMRFLTNIPTDLKSLHKMHKDRLKKKEGSDPSSPRKVGTAANAGLLALGKNEDSESGKHPRELAKISPGVGWRGRHPKSAYRMRHLKPKVLAHKRLCFVGPSGNIPVAILSVLPYTKGKIISSTVTSTNPKRRSKRTSGSRPLSIVSNDLLFEATLSIEGIQQPGNEEEVSYKALLEESTVSSIKPFATSELENPEWKLGSHRTVLTFPSYIVSVIDYTKPLELKKDLNARFREKFPQVNITLSKCRSLKASMQRIASSQNVERSATERAFEYFDRLVMSGKVIKGNRRHCAGVCLLLSAKVNSDLRPGEISRLISGIEHGLKVGRHDLVLFEFPVFAALQFFLIYFP